MTIYDLVINSYCNQEKVEIVLRKLYKEDINRCIQTLLGVSPTVDNNILMSMIIDTIIENLDISDATMDAEYLVFHSVREAILVIAFLGVGILALIISLIR